MVTTRRHALGYYSAVGIMNLAAVVMFYAITLPIPPVYAAPAPPPRIKIHAVPATQGLPIRVTVPSLSIDLPVQPGTYDPASGNWTIDLHSAYYADTSMPINNSNGTTLIYGHAQSPVFASLPTIQPGAEAVVTTDTGYAFHYRYQSLRQVDPTDTSVFTAGGPPILVLQTCIGNYSEYRALFSFTLTAIDTL